MQDFVDITSGDNWFKKHPEKIAGKEYKTTSLHFPIQVKGTKEDVLRVTQMQTDIDILKLRSRSRKRRIQILALMK
jgi:RNase P/RNase MRP subunit p30